jgi:pantothenate kinase type III
LPRTDVHQRDRPPAAPGKSTVTAIEAGLYWGAVGAIRELTQRYSHGESLLPDVFLSGGASAKLVELLGSADSADEASGRRVMHVPHLVLAGIALVDQPSATEA